MVWLANNSKLTLPCKVAFSPDKNTVIQSEFTTVYLGSTLLSDSCTRNIDLSHLQDQWSGKISSGYRS